LAIYKYSTNTSTGDPGSGFFRFVGQSWTYTGSHVINIGDEAFSPTVNLEDLWDLITNAGGQGPLINTVIKLVKKTNTNVYKYLQVTDASAQSGYGNFTCSVIDVSSSSPSNGDEILVELAISGVAGANGFNGSNGSSGSSGSSGISGTSGTSGATGTSGTSGATGTSGTSGATGTSGTSGATGTSGTSGATGTSGTSGASVSVSGTNNRVVKFTSSTTIGNSNASDDGTTFQIDTSNLKVTTSAAIGNINPTGITGRLDAQNDVVAFSTSDERLKENFNPIQYPIEKIKSIHGYEFNWIEELSHNHGFHGHDVGVIAQEIEKILPEIVTTKFNGYKGVKYEKIIPLLIESIKELHKEIEILKKNCKN
jgi:hypothetical protein